MQLVIEISDTLKNIVDDEDAKTFSHIVWQAIVMDAIKNGQSLPKGHGRLIDADAKDLQSELWTFTRYTGIDEAPYEDACMALDKAPTIVEADGGDAE